MTISGRNISVILLLFLGTSGCVGPWFKKDERTEAEKKGEAILEILEDEKRPRLIGEIARPRGLHMAKVQGIGLLNGLPGTGGDPRPSEQRENLLQEIRTHNVRNPNELIASPTTALVMISAFVPPAIQIDDRIDIIVKTSEISEAKSLQSGWLMPTRLREFRTLGGSIRQSDVFGMAAGSLVTEADTAMSPDPLKQLRGVIPGGGRMTVSRGLSLIVSDDFSHVFTARAISESVNKRFFHFDGSTRRGAAVPKRDQMIEIEMDPKYRLDPFHYMNVIMSLGFSERSSQQAERMELCRRQLMEPTTARKAALQLEAIGKPGVEALMEGMLAGNDEVRFYCAHSLAYLNDSRCIETLEQLAITQPAFRAMCLNSLAIVDHFDAQEALVRLLQIPEPEVRYGALCALRVRDARDPLVCGIQMGNVTRVVQIPTADTPIVTISLSELPQIAIFGSDPRLTIGTFARVNNHILLRKDDSGQLRVSRIVPGEADRIELVPMTLTGMIHGLVEVGATYGDIVLAIMTVSSEKGIPYPVLLDPKPKAGRTYSRNGEESNLPWDKTDPAMEEEEIPLEAIEVAGEKSEEGSDVELASAESESSTDAEQVSTASWWNWRSWTGFGASNKDSAKNEDASKVQ